MEDIFSKYKKHKVLQHTGIVVASLFFALGINLSLDSSSFSQYLKSSVLESQVEVVRADLYLEKSGNSIIIKNGSEFSDIKSINFSISYNPENINIENTIKNIDNYTINIVNSDLGISNIQINSQSESQLIAGSILGEIQFSAQKQGIDFLNILNANIEDINGNMYYLTTQGVEI